MFHALMSRRSRDTALAMAYVALVIAVAGAAPPQKAIEAAAPGSEVSDQDASGSPALTQQPPAQTSSEQPVETPSEHATVIRVLIVVGPLAAVVALMGLYWLILRRGAM
jgi:hypothetical protein